MKSNNELRQIEAIKIGPLPPGEVEAPPIVRTVAPGDLWVEPSYQRDISRRSLSLIRKIATGWDWRKFKPPICAETERGLSVIDGQHTAIAAATRGVKKIPVLVVSVPDIENRADAFVSHNRDRLLMSQNQLFWAAVTAGDKEAARIAEIAENTGAFIPRSTSPRSAAMPGQIQAIYEIRAIMSAQGEDAVTRIFKIAVGAQVAPLTRNATRSLRMLITEPYFADIAKMPDSRIANGLRSVGDIDTVAKAEAIDTGQGIIRAGAILIAEKCRMEQQTAA